MKENRRGPPPNGGEQALRDSELSYRRLFEAAQDGILILDVNTGRVNDVNPFLHNLLGFSKGEIMGKTIGELSPFSDVVSNHAMLTRLKKDDYVRYDNLPLKAKDGHRVQVEFVCNVYQAGDRKVIQCNVRDITKRKAAEQRLFLLTACISNLNDIVLVTEAEPIDEPGPRIVFVNEAFERITGYTSAEALGRSRRFLQGEGTDRKVLAEIHQALKQQKAIRRQLVNYNKNGTKYWLDVDIVPVLDAAGNCTHFASIERDITEAKKSEARFRRLVDSNVQCVAFFNTKGEVSEANDAFLHLVGYTREELRGVKINWLSLTPPEFNHLDRRALQELSSKGTCAPYEKEYICKDGSRVPVILGAAVLEDDPENGVCFLLDLTEQKKLEKQFLRAQRMESIGTLAGGIAHDLNNILAPIMMSIEMLKTFSENSPQTQRILTTIEVCARRGADIVRQVLSFARGMDGDRVEIQPKHLLHDLSTIVRDTFPRDIRLEFSIPNDTWTILGDPTQVQQILLNLCVNARDAMPAGGILSIGAKNCVLDEHYVAMNVQAKPGRYVNITVTDTGMGIPPSIIHKIYEPFFTTKEINKSTGLGLSTVTAIVKSHEGLINVYSEMGKGTTFNVYLPAMENPSGGRKGKADDGKFPRGKGETVLVVDDEASILNITRQTLLAFGYRVLTAVNGADAVAVYAENKSKIAVVLADTMMPIMGGTAMTHALRRINPAIKIIASSGLNANGNLADVGDAAAKDFLVKPYTAKALLLAVRRILDEA